jgi:hypothetical protein
MREREREREREKEREEGRRETAMDGMGTYRLNDI